MLQGHLAASDQVPSTSEMKPCSEAICVKKEPLSAVISRLQLTDTLAQNIVKCGKIQNSLNKLVLLQSHVKASLSCLFEATF
ncbi:hypothetical protein P5673_019608 [Acropora cervicornis]|uniref:Uncharacterized protein n=1 Tax=Acropora cervicornis TaxID=6130 RepID=A0AAD9QBX7_ACRCE|nr:hypothetical protein P5673_019608 [Acropora cervicornis]